MVKTNKKVAEIKPSDLDWLNDINMENVNKVSELDIIPSIKVGLNESVKIKLLELPKSIKFADNNEYFCSEVIH